MQSPLTELTLSAGAVFPSSDQSQQPVHYGNSRVEYDTALTGAVVRDCSHLGRVLFSGPDHLDFLHRMSSNDFANLATGCGMQAVLTDNRGRILELGTFFRHEDRTLAIVSSGGGQRVLEWLDRFLFSESVEMSDLTNATAMVEILGPHAFSVVATVVGTEVPSDGHMLLRVPGDDDVWMARSGRPGLEGVVVCGPPQSLESVWLDLLASGALPVGEDAHEILRIEAGLPSAGAELSDAHNPWEAGLGDTIHLDKGCYIGQEVLARLNTYDKVKQHLVGLRLPFGSPAPAAVLQVSGKDVGSVTSMCHSPRHGDIGLAYVRTAHATAGTELFADGEISATVTELPFR